MNFGECGICDPDKACTCPDEASSDSDIKPIVITEKHVMAFRKKLLNYVRKENPDSSDFGYRTYLLDMLYFMGLAIDEERFFAAKGFDEFKKFIKQELEP